MTTNPAQTRSGDRALLARAACLLAVASATLVGCGDSGPRRVVVQGQVTFKGEPVTNGQVYFYPTGETRGPVSGGPIKEGRYVAKARGGVLVGTHRVEVTGFRRPAGAAGGDEAIPREQYLPAQFNTYTELTAEIDGQEDPATQDFHLE